MRLLFDEGDSLWGPSPTAASLPVWTNGGDLASSQSRRLHRANMRASRLAPSSLSLRTRLERLDLPDADDRNRQPKQA